METGRRIKADMKEPTIWQEKIQLLREHGLTFREIGEEAGCAPSTISDLLSGRSHTASFEVGTKLIALHKKVAAKQRPH